MVGLGTLARVWSLSYGLPDVYHPDEARIVTRAVGFHAGDWNPHFFNWPSLSMYLLSGVYAVVFGPGPGGVAGAFARDPATFYLVGRLVTAAFGSATLAALYGLAAPAYGPAVALLAAAFLGMDLLHVHDSQFVTTDVPLACLVTLGMSRVLRYARDGRRRDAWLAGLLTGLAASMKYPGALVALPLVLAHLGRPATGGRAWWRRLGSPALVGAGVAALLGFLAGTPFALLSPREFVRGVLSEVSEVRTVQFGNEGDLPAPLFHLTHSIPVAMGWPLAVLALAGLVLAVSGGAARDRLLLAFPVPYFLVIATWSSRFERYVVPILPFTALLAALALVALARRVWPERGALGRVPLALRLALLAALVATPAVGRVIRFHALLARPDTRVVASAWIERQVPAGTRIALEPYSPSLPVAAAMLRQAPREAAATLATPAPPAGAGGPASAAGSARGYWLVRLDRYDLERLVRDRVEYVVLSSFVYRRNEGACDRNPAPCRFYAALAERGRLVLAVDTGVPDDPLWVGDIYAPLTRLWARVRPGPAIRVYRLSGQADP